MIKTSELPGQERSRRFEGAEHGSTVSCFIGAYPPGFRPPLHRHPYEETFILQEGSACFTAGSEEIEISAGHIYVVPAGTPHTFIVTGEGPLRMVSIHPRERMEQEDLE